MNNLLSQPPLDQTLIEIAELYDRLLEFRGPKRSGKTTLLDALGCAIHGRPTSRFTRTSKWALDQFQRRVRHGAPLPTPNTVGPEQEQDKSNSCPIECVSFFNGSEKTLAVAYPHDPRSLDSQSTARLYREQPQRTFSRHSTDPSARRNLPRCLAGLVGRHAPCVRRQGRPTRCLACGL